MAFSFTQHTGDGETTTFSFSFVGPGNGYYEEDQIKVYLDDVDTNFTLSGPNQITLDEAPVEGVSIWIKREPDITDTYTNFARGNNFGKDNINRAFQQMLYLVQRIQDGFKEVGYYQKQDMNLGSFKITNLAEGTDDTDGVNKAQLDVVSTAATEQASLAASYADAASDSAALALSYVTAGETTLNTIVTNGSTALNTIITNGESSLNTIVTEREATLEGYVTSGASSAEAASTSETNAAASEDLAEKWAENPEDTEVTTGKYSSYHWAQKAEGYVTAGASAVPFTPAGSITNDTVQTAIEELDSDIQDYLKDTIANVTLFGAIGDGSTDDTTAIQAAISYIASTYSEGGIVFFPEGDYLCSNLSVLGNGIILVGCGPGTRIINNGTNTPAITIGNGTTTYNRNGVREMVLTQATGVTPVLGNCGLSFKKCAAFSLERINVHQYPSSLYDGLLFNGCTQFILDKVQVQDCLHDGITFSGGCIDCYMSSTRSDSNRSAGIVIGASEGFYWSCCSAYNNSNNGILIGLGGGSNSCKNMFFSQVIADTSGVYNWNIGGLYSSKFVGCWGSTQISQAANTFASGFIFSGSDVHDLTLTDCIAINNNSHGVYLASSVYNVSFVNCTLGNSDHGNGQSGAGYGLSTDGSCTNITITGGMALNNTTGSLYSVVSGSVVNCLGYKTEAFGTASFTTNSNGEATVAHGLAGTPTYAQAEMFADTSWELTVVSVDATNITVRVRDTTTNNDIKSAAITMCHWIAKL